MSVDYMAIMPKADNKIDFSKFPPCLTRDSEPRKFGYARVSREDQSVDSQVEALTKAGCFIVFRETASGGDSMHRSEFEAVLRHLHRGDVLVVVRLDRASRSVAQLLELLGWLRANDIGFESLREGRFDATPIGTLLLHTAAVFAEFERNLIRERTMAGLEIARKLGRRGGRKRALHASDMPTIEDLVKRLPISEVAARYRVSSGTLHRYLKEHRESQSKLTRANGD